MGESGLIVAVFQAGIALPGDSSTPAAASAQESGRACSQMLPAVPPWCALPVRRAGKINLSRKKVIT